MHSVPIRKPTPGPCEHCGGRLQTRTLPEYRDPVLGIPGAVLIDAVEETRCGKCGKRHSIIIPDLEGLIRVAAVTRVKHPLKLSGTDIRFLRSAMDWTAKMLADRISVRKESVSRWENDREVISETTEKLLRMVIGVNLAARAPGVDFDAREIARLVIHPVRPARVTLTLRFELVKVPRRKTRTWGEAEAA